MSLELNAVTALRQQRRRERPLDEFRCSSRGQELVVEHAANGTFVYAHAAERSGKSKIGAAVTSAFCTGESGIQRRDGSMISLPVLKPPVQWLLGFDSYKLGGVAVIPTLRGLLPEGGYAEEAAGGASGSPSIIRVRHKHSTGENDWSRIAVFPFDGVRPRSMELDGAWLDEGPPILYLDAVEARRGVGRTLRVVITETPLERRFWQPLVDRYPREEGVVESGRVRIRWSVFDNESLDAAMKEALRVTAMASAFWKAKLYGQHVDAEGGKAWSEEILAARMALTRPPLTIERIVIQAEKLGPGGKQLVEVVANVSIWEKVIPGDPYYMVGDPAKGLRSGGRDPDGFLMRNRRTRSYVAELTDYIGGWGLGNLMVKLGTRYNNAIADPLVTGGYAESMLSSLRHANYRHLTHSRVEVRPGEWEDRVGTVETETSRGAMIGAVEQMLLTGSGDIPSARAIQTLMDCIIDAKGKIVADTGKHDEFLACLGRSEVYLNQWKAPAPRRPVEEPYESVVLRDRRLREKADEALAIKKAAVGRYSTRPLEELIDQAINIEP